MASRFFGGSKPSKPKTRPDPPAERPSALPKRSAIPAPPAKTSALPSKVSRPPARQPSSLPRSGSTTARPVASTSATARPLVTRDTVVEHSTRPRALSNKEQGKSAAGLPTGIPPGMGTRTEITATNAPVQRNRLRRKASSQDQRSRYTSSEGSDSTYEPGLRYTASEVSTIPSSYVDPFPGSILGISMPEPSSFVPTYRTETTPTEYATSSSRMASYVSRQPHKISTADLPPPTPGFAARSTSSSTRYSESPGPFSRTSTPTSASSQSPGVHQVPKFAPRAARQSLSPTRSRPPVTRRNFGAQERVEEHGLPALRESQTSSSSSSTVKGVEMTDRSDARRIARTTKHDRPPPTPPLRLSSKRDRPQRSFALTPDARTQAPAAETQAPVVEEPKAQPASRLAKPSQTPSTQSRQGPSKLPALANNRPKLPPSRPSRQGVISLQESNAAVIVKSNLNQLSTTGHKRRESAEKIALASPLKIEEKRPSLDKLARTPSISESPSRQPTKLPSVTSPHLVSREGSKGQDALALRADLLPRPTRREQTPRSASPSKAATRFGLFSRRIKPPSETSSTSPSVRSPPPARTPAKLTKSSPEKLTKKGPAAGTGHEGYGRHARRVQSGSVSSAASRGRSTSTERSHVSARPISSRKSSFGSNDGQPELDDFYKERLEPVVIGGGGKIRENRNSQASLYQSTSGQTSLASVANSSRFTSPSHVSLDTSAEPSTAASSQRVSRDMLPPPVLATAGLLPEPGSLAHRRSLHRSQLFGQAEVVTIPAPIKTNVLAPSPSIDTYDSTLSSAPRTDASIYTDDMSEGHEGNWLRSKKKMPVEKKKLTKKWNFFQRAQRSPERPSLELQRPSIERRESPNENNQRLVTGGGRRDPRTVAHYEMLDETEPEADEEEDLENLLRNIEGNLDLGNESDASELQADIGERQHSMLLPSPPKFLAKFENFPSRPVTPKVSLQLQPVLQQRTAVPSPEPYVQLPVRKPSRLQQVGRIPRVVSKRDRLHNPAPHSFSRPFAPRNNSLDETPSAPIHSDAGRLVLGIHTDPLPSLPFNRLQKPTSALPTNGMLYNPDGEDEFLRFSPLRNNSGTSASSSSGVLSFAPMTAATPESEGVLSEDEVWNEYDELLDHVGSSADVPDSPYLGDMLSSFPSLSNIRSAHPAAKRESPLMASDGSSDTVRDVSPPQPAKARPDQLQMPSQENSHNPLSSPISLSELYANYGNRSSNLSTVPKPNPRHSTISAASGSRYSSQTMLSESGSRSSIDSNQIKRVTQVMAEKTFSASSDSLRFSALMTSRWLSFDRVLFSPAQEEIIANRQNRVLVLDGLENDDWSAYCALTYPDAIVYNLASSGKNRGSADTANSDSWVPPSNLRRVYYSSFAGPFPFPKGFFTVVVFRFPVASASHAYRNAISECKRVLRPGGYLELSILDMDMVNMGNRARRAVRGVKERMQLATPEVSLSPASDTVMKLLGRRGFENLNRCVVSVPVTGAVSDSRAGSSDDSPSSARPENAKTLTDLLSGAQKTGSHYTGANMIARVGRWWWNRCYESGVVDSNKDVKSVWDDVLLMRECEEKETGLRLVVCYAQKPESVRRRTVSV